MLKVSIIVPVYNTEKYLVQCLDSLVNQTLKEIEIICVNDGSPDNSYKILDRYAKTDKRIRIINQENAGLSAARNTGMALATAEYIGFVDSDDWVDESMFEKLYREAKSKNTDISFCSVYRYNDIEGALKDDDFLNLSALPEDLNGKVFNMKDINPFDVMCAAWNKIYRTDFLNKWGFRFTEGLIFEDVLFWHQIVLKAEKITLIRDKFYFYRKPVENSLTAEFNSRYFDIIPITNKTIEAYKASGLFEQYAADLLDFKLSRYHSRIIVNKELLNRKQYQLLQSDLKSTNLSAFGQSNFNHFKIVLIRQNYFFCLVYMYMREARSFPMKAKEVLVTIIGDKNKRMLKKLINSFTR